MKKKMLLITTLVFVVFGVIIFIRFSKDDISFYRMTLEYKIKPEKIEEKIINIDTRIWTKNSKDIVEISLVKGLVEVLYPECFDQNGNKIPFSDDEGIITIGPISKDVEYIDYSYKVILGEITGEKAMGDLYEDLMVFSGENTLLFPLLDDIESDTIGKYIDKVSIEVEIQEDWNAIIPFQKNINQDNKVAIDNPDWYTFYNLAKSCYAFGKFEPLTIQTIDGTYNFLVDVASKQRLTSENITTMTNIYNYYAQIFGEGLTDYAVVLLRNELKQDMSILGGVGGKTLGISHNIKTGEDWYTFSRTLYHAFFDSKIHAKNLHFPPNLWLYKGLAEYHIDKSAVVIPPNIKGKYGITVDESLESLYTRYLYFTVKEPLLKVSPAHEESMQGAQSEYYYNTKVPLVVNEIENMAQERNGTINNLIGVLMKYSNEKNINMANIMTELLGRDEAKIRAYLAGEEIIPYSGKRTESENFEQVILELDQYERYLTLLFQNDIEGYPYDPVFLLKPEDILKEAQSRNFNLVSEEKIRNHSEVVYLLLMQHLLRADMCGEKDLSLTDIRFKLNSDENMEKWMTYINKVGLYGSK